MNVLCTRTFVLLVLCATAAWHPAIAGDWPQVLGPQRNGIAENEKISLQWPATGPTTLWQRPVGSGFAGVAVAKNRAILFHRDKEKQFVEAMDAATGKMIWRASLPARYRPSIIPDDGPRSVPLIDDNRVYVLDAAGLLTAIDFDSGKQLWQHDLQKQFNAAEGYFGFGSSPIAEGDNLLVNVGGKEAGIVAFDLKSGRIAWKSTGELASYSSPIATTIGNTRHVIFITRYNIVSIDPQTGKSRFSIPFGKRGPTVNGANPVVVGDLLFASASYGVGAVAAKIQAPQEAEILYRRDDVLSSQYPTAVFHQGVLYGIDGRQDVGVARLRAVDPTTGKIHWTESGFGMAVPILVGDSLLLMKTDGRLVLADASREAFRMRASAKLFDGTVRALPALSNGRLYVRDEQTLKCIDLRKK